MSKLDEFINNDIAIEFDQWNLTEKRMKRPETRSYKKLSNRIYASRKKLIQIKEKENSIKPTPLKEWSSESKIEYRETVELIREMNMRRFEIPYTDKKRAILRFCYVRYADDWVFFTNCDQGKTEYIKERIANFLLQDLKLKLSPEKTKITYVKTERVKFLGFSMSYYAATVRRLYISADGYLTKPRILKGFQTIKLNQVRKKINFIKRTTGNQLIIGIDEDRLDSRFKQKRFMKRNNSLLRGNRKAEWSTLTDYEIIMRYNYVIRGLVNYYSPMIRDFSILNKYIYVLNYSCAHTLANKHRTTLKKIFRFYGKPLTAVSGKKKTIPNNTKEKQITLWRGENDNKKDKERKVTLLSYLACRDIANKLSKKSTENADQDFLTVRVH